MSRKYKCPADVPNNVLAQRLNVLAIAVAGGRDALLREFDMRIPVELDRDADVVLSLSSTRINDLTTQLEAKQAKIDELTKYINYLDNRVSPPPEN